jgi:chemotaxis protein histidine kinase CheA
MLEANSLSTPLSDFASPMDLAEAQLQRELRSMFDVDTQTYLQTYTDLVQRLQPATWTAEIQELYRCVHTIKGGAVTVGADGILYVSTVLEDLLSDLRYLQVAPPLEDGQLTAMLLEAGELLTASLQVHAQGAAAQLAVQPSVDRISVLRAAIQQTYLPEASEQSQLFQEFAEQGLIWSY